MSALSHFKKSLVPFHICTCAALPHGSDKFVKKIDRFSRITKKQRASAMSTRDFRDERGPSNKKGRLSSDWRNETYRFRLSDSCLLVLQKGDITKWSVPGKRDAIVNAANERMLGGGGVDGAIHEAAGPELLDACEDAPEVTPGVRCPTGSAVITRGFNLAASRIIHTVGPVYTKKLTVKGESSADLLARAYRSALKVAADADIQYIAFPAISCGVYGYPYEDAATVALKTVKENSNDLLEIHFVLFNDPILQAWLAEAQNSFPSDLVLERHNDIG